MVASVDLRRWNVTDAEATAAFPCDELVADAGPVVRITRGIDIAAPADRVFRWLCQLKVAPYSYDLLDNLGRRSPRTLTPGAERLEVGQRFLIFRLTSFEPGRHLTGRSLPLAVTIFGTLAGTYSVEPRGGRASRLLVRLAQAGSRTPLDRIRNALLVPGDLVMMRKQLRVLKERAEAAEAA
jgi:hypothetical protein